MGGRGAMSSFGRPSISATEHEDNLVDQNGERDDWWNIEDGWSFQELMDKVPGNDAKSPSEALTDWLGSSGPIRAASRGDVGDPQYSDYARELEGFISLSDGYSRVMYRGICVDDKVLRSLKVGATIDQQGISSWSKHLATADNFAYEGDGRATNSVIFRMKGSSRARDVSAYNRSEMEVILSSKSSQVITGIVKKNGIMYVDVKEV